MGRLRRGRRKCVPVGSVAASMRLTPLHNLPTRPRTCSVCVHHGKQRRKSKATVGRFARSSRSSFRWIYIHQLTNEKSRADARLHRECFIHAWRGSTVSTRVDTHQQQHRPVPTAAENCRRRGGSGCGGVRGMDAAAKPPGMGLRRPPQPDPPRHPSDSPRLTLLLLLLLPASGRHYHCGCRAAGPAEHPQLRMPTPRRNNHSASAVSTTTKPIISAYATTTGTSLLPSRP